jgi:hypothetical protein
VHHVEDGRAEEEMRLTIKAVAMMAHRQFVALVSQDRFKLVLE